MVRTIEGSDFSIRVEVFEEPGARKTAPKCGSISSKNLYGHGHDPFIDAIENLILNHACAGVKIDSKYSQGVVETLTAIRQADELGKVNVSNVMEEEVAP